jgi:5-methylcytosine-specific restriction protein A
MAEKFQFRVGDKYRRRDVFQVIGIPTETKGGNWDTGYNKHGDDWFVFCNIGTAGRTGHDYGNRFIGDDLLWYGKTGSRADHPSIRSLTDGHGKVYLFYREDDREPFVYAGSAFAKQIDPNKVPVEVLWSFDDEQPRIETLSEEVDARATYAEGSVKQITVNAYERDPNARRKCVEHFGPKCVICQFDFEEEFGELGRGYIHVHHLKPLGELDKEYRTDPVNDLRPVCTNCHAMLHRRKPALTIEELITIYKSRKNGG